MNFALFSLFSFALAETHSLGDSKQGEKYQQCATQECDTDTDLTHLLMTKLSVSESSGRHANKDIKLDEADKEGTMLDKAPTASPYYVGVSKVGWDEAERDCQARGRHLVTICSGNQWREAIDQVQDNAFWIGLSRVQGGDWSWADGQKCDWLQQSESRKLAKSKGGEKDCARNVDMNKANMRVKVQDCVSKPQKYLCGPIQA
jgi:hypothetical protein